MRADLIAAAGSWLLTYLLHSTLLLGAAWLATRRLIQAPAVRDLLWKAALLGGVVTASLQAGLGFEPLGGALALKLEAARAPSAPHAATPMPDLIQGFIPPPAPAPSSAPVARGVGESSQRAAVAPKAEVTESHTDWLPLALSVWGTIAGMLCGLYLIQRARAMRRIGPRRQVSDATLLDMLEGLRRVGNVRREIRLTSADGLASPVALGASEIALPEAALTDLEPDQQRSMLAHELAHLERRDPTWLTLGCLMERAFFFQPLNRLARVRLQEAAEYLCDDWAVRRTGSGVSLATCLVKVAEWIDPPHPIPMAGMAEHRSQLVTRIHRLIEGRAMSATPRSIWFLAGAVALIGVTAVAAPGFTPVRTDLAAQGTVQAPVATPEPDSSESWARRLARQAGLVRVRAQIDAARARAEVRRAIAEARAAAPPVQPVPPPAPVSPAPAVAAMRSDLVRMSMRAAAIAGGAGRDRQHDTTSIAVPALIAALKDGDVEVRRAAAQSLSNLEDPRAIPAFIEALKDSDAEVRTCAASALGEFEDKRAVPGLIALLKDPNTDVRHAALSSLGNFSDQVPVEAILTALADSDPDIKVSALNLVCSHDGDDEKPVDPRVIQAVIGLIGNPNANVRAQAIETISSLQLKEAPAGLLAAAKDKNPDVRQHVAEALGSIHDPRAVPTLKELVQDPNADVRESAVEALGEIRDRTALEALVGALKSSDAGVRRRAAEALGQRDDEDR